MAIYTGSNKHLGGTETVTKKQQFFYGLVQKNILVTGANGQLGQEIKVLSQQTDSIFHFIFTDACELDITQFNQLSDFVKQHAIQYIINCAAYTAVDKAESEVEQAYLINAAGAGNLAKVAAQQNCRFIHISTDYVFDGQATAPYTETTPANPLSVYGKSKLKGEETVLENNPQAIIIRTSWLYSEFGANFVKTMLRLMTQRDELNIIADQKGTPTYAADLAEMIVHILEDSEKTEWKPGIYHFSNQGETTWFGFAEKIKELASIDICTLNPIKTSEYETTTARPVYSVLDKSKIQSAFRVEIPTWENALKRCMNKLKTLNTD